MADHLSTAPRVSSYAPKTENSACCTAAEEIDRVRAAATADLQNLQTDVLAKNREIGRLKRELSEVIDEDSPEAQSVKALLDLWWREVKGSDPRVKHDLKSTRAPKVRKALKRRGVETCQKAILGVVHDDWAMGRVAKSGGKDFNDIADHILSSDADIEKFAKLYDQHHKPAEPEPQPVAVSEKPRRRKDPTVLPIERVLGALTGSATTTRNPDEWEALCPAHDDSDPSLVVRRNPDGMVWIKCWAGCSKESILAALGLDWRDLFEHSERDPNAANAPYRGERLIPPHLANAMQQLLARNERKAA